MSLPRVQIAIPVGLNGTVDYRILVWGWILAQERDGVTCHLDLHVQPDKEVCQTRNRQTRFLLQNTDFDYVLFMDRDCVPDLPGFDYLLEAIQREDVDAVGGWSVMHWENDQCVPMILNPSGKRRDGSKGAVIATEVLGNTPGLYEIKDLALATHALMVSREVLQRFWDEGIVWWEDIFCKDPESEKFGARTHGHDILFCSRMQDLGYRLWLDTRVFWGHIKPLDMRKWFLDNLRNKEEIYSHVPAVRILRRMWGNFSFTAPEEYLLRLCTEVQRMPPGSMAVECGSGLSTLILREMLPPERFLSLESEESWLKDLQAKAGDELPSVVHAPLRDYGEFEWYSLPQMNGTPISLVVCDGPKRDDCRGGRVGMLDVLKPYLAERFTLLVDDAHIIQGHEPLQQWLERDDFVFRKEGVDCTPDGVNPPRRFMVLKGVKKEAVDGHSDKSD